LLLPGHKLRFCFDKLPDPVKPAARQLRQFQQFPLTCRRRLLVNSIDEILKFRNGAADRHQRLIIDRESTAQPIARFI
jgi:hypothetical protein